MRIVSLLPSATEILFALGAGPDVVGVSFECDHPQQARERRVVSSTTMPEGLSTAEIDRFVSGATARGEDLYRLDAGALADLDADLVVTQDLCGVCAVDVTTVDQALAHLGCRADVLSLDPHTLEEVLGSVEAVGRATDRDPTAVLAALRERLTAVESRVAGLPRPRVLVLEWTDPPYTPGHWLPEMVAVAGGTCTLGAAGEKSVRVTWDDVRASSPDVVVVAPCGLRLEAAVAEAERLRTRGVLPAAAPVWAVDADASFARPGPRLVDGVETLGALLHGGDPDPRLARRLADSAGRPNVR